LPLVTFVHDGQRNANCSVVRNVNRINMTHALEV